MVVPLWFPCVIYLLIAVTCAMPIWDDIKWVLRRFGQLQMHPSLHANLKKLLALEILSFVSLFGIGVALLEFHRFQAGISVFACGTAALAVSILLAALGLKSRLGKVATVILVYAAAIAASEY